MLDRQTSERKFRMTEEREREIVSDDRYRKIQKKKKKGKNREIDR